MSFSLFRTAASLPVFCLALLVSVPALATESTEAAASGGFWATVLPAFVAALVLILGALGTFASTWLKGKSAEQGVSTAKKVAEQLSAKLLEIMVACVRSTWAAMREQMEAAAADGTITAEEGKALREAALQAFLSSLGDTFKAQVLGSLGLSDSGLTTYASGLVEKAVDIVKLEKSRESTVHAQAAAIVAEAQAKTAQHEKTSDELLAHLSGQPAEAKS